MEHTSLPEGLRKTLEAMRTNSVAVQWDDYGDGPIVAFMLKNNNDSVSFFFLQPEKAREIAISLLIVAEKVDEVLAANKQEESHEE